MRSIVLVVAAAIVYSVTAVQAGAQELGVFTTGLAGPTKIITAGQSHLLVAETGSPMPNTGRISLVDRRTGERRTLISGLPSAFNAVEQAPSGPSGIKLVGRTLYVTIGQGDSVVPGTPSGIFPNPNPATPLNNSILSLSLPADYEALLSEFTLTPGQQQMMLGGGRGPKLINAEGMELGVNLVANLPDHRPDSPPGSPAGNVRPANVFGVEWANGNLYVVDASFNQLYKLYPEKRSFEVFSVFPPKPNPLPFGPPFVEAVPDSVRLFGDRLLVSFLTGFPFAQGLAEVRIVSLVDGDHAPFISNLTSAMDVLPVAITNGRSAHYTLEFTTNFLQQPMPPGRLLISTPAENVVVLDDLISPTSMARDGETGDLFVTEIFTGRIIRVPGTYDPGRLSGGEE